MPVTGSRLSTVEFAIGFLAANTFVAANNTLSPGQVEIRSLAIGANTITPPNIAAVSVPVACLIQPPAGNTNTITLKGIAGDTGVVLHKTDHSVIALNSPSATFVLSASAQIDGVRLVWI